MAWFALRKPRPKQSRATAESTVSAMSALGRAWTAHKVACTQQIPLATSPRHRTVAKILIPCLGRPRVAHAVPSRRCRGFHWWRDRHHDTFRALGSSLVCLPRARAHMVALPSDRRMGVGIRFLARCHQAVPSKVTQFVPPIGRGCQPPIGSKRGAGNRGSNLIHGAVTGRRDCHRHRHVGGGFSRVVGNTRGHRSLRYLSLPAA
jgi:hypothetical protein